MHRRTGDAIAIDGAYQYRAITEGHPVQRHWHRSKLLVVDELLRPATSDRVLDVGCGSGVVAAHVAETGAQVTAVDGNPAAIEFGLSRFQNRFGDRLNFIVGLLDELQLEPGSYDKAISLEVIEHLHRPQAEIMLAGIARALKPGGLLLITTPNYFSAWPLIEVGLDLFGLVPRLKDAQHVSKYTHARLESVCSAAGFSLVRQRSICTIGPWLAPLSEHWADRATRFEVHRRIPSGTILAHLYRRD